MTDKFPRWLTDDVRAQMGFVPDAQIASDVGLSTDGVGRWRRRLGIASFRANSVVDWSAVDPAGLDETALVALLPEWLTLEVRQMMGTITDQRLARKVGQSRAKISTWRTRLRISPLNPKGTINWDAVALGARSDAQIARELGVDHNAVAYQRKKRQIPLYRRHSIDWSSVGLGERADRVIAAELGVSRFMVGKRRGELGIESKAGNRLGIDWDAQPLGEMSDRELAFRLGVGASTVRTARRRRGIEPAGRRLPAGKEVDWDAVEGLGQRPDREIAEALKVRVSRVGAARRKRQIEPFTGSNIRGINWDAQRLGQVPDVDLARRLGVTPSTVSAARLERGIGPYTPPKPTVTEADGLGFLPDTVISKRTGVAKAQVRAAREERGIGVAPRSVDWSLVPDEDFLELTNVALGHMLGVSTTTVAIARKARGFKPWSQAIDWSKVTGFGEVFDKELAKRHGVSPSSISKRRRALGIPAFRPKSGPKLATTASVALEPLGDSTAVGGGSETGPR